MAHLDSTPARKALTQHMLADHGQIAALVEKLRNEAEANVRPELEETWAELETELLQHFESEELYLFPALSREHPDESAALRAEHDAIRALLAEVGVGVELHTVRLETLTDIADLLRAHADREAKLVYPWSDTSTEPGPRSLLARFRRLAL